MSVSDPIADMLAKIRYASLAKFEKVDIPASKLKVEIVKILKNEGFIKTFKKVAQDGTNQIRIYLKYDDRLPDRSPRQCPRPLLRLPRRSRPSLPGTLAEHSSVWEKQRRPTW